jgi:hypothetical protein
VTESVTGPQDGDESYTPNPNQGSAKLNLRLVELVQDGGCLFDNPTDFPRAVVDSLADEKVLARF